MKRIKLSPPRKLTYFEKYRKFIDKEKLFLEEMIRISYNLGREDVIQEDIENHKRLFPEPTEFDKSNLTGLKSMSNLEELLKQQNGKLTLSQISQFFKCFGNSCSNWNLGSYKCEIGKCKGLNDAIEKYLEEETNLTGLNS